LVLEYAGKDVEEILKDADSHFHSEAAYDVLDETVVGFLASDKATKAVSTNGAVQNGVAASTEKGADATYVHPRTGMSSAEDLSKDTDYSADYKKHKFLDLSKPLLLQIWFGGFSKEFYLDQVHRPRHYKGGKSAPLFGNFLEPLSLTPWWVVPMIWLPCVAYGTYVAATGLSGPIELAAYWVFGVFFWTLVEYVLHRFLFHLDQYVIYILQRLESCR
jgi:4-hydroxysphinganine ceramide fatty acyl 2-hydroxylase